MDSTTSVLVCHRRGQVFFFVLYFQRFVRHWIFVSEYMYRVLQPTDAAQQVTVEDMGGVQLQVREEYGTAPCTILI